MNKPTLSRYTVPLVSSLLLASVALAACSQGSTPSSTPNQKVSATTSNSLDDLGELDKGKKISPKKALRSETVQPKNKPIGRAQDIKLSKRASGKIDTFSDSEEGVSVSNLNFEMGTDTNGDGAANETVQAQVNLADEGEHKVVLMQDNFPIMSSQNDQVTVKDETTGNTRVYSADQDLFRFSVKDGGSGIDIETLPDGSWLINGEAAANPAAAAKLVMKSPVIADASLHGLMLLYQTFKQEDKLPAQYLVETLFPAPPCGTPSFSFGGPTTGCTGLPSATSFGDPKPLLKAVIKLKKEARREAKKAGK